MKCDVELNNMEKSGSLQNEESTNTIKNNHLPSSISPNNDVISELVKMADRWNCSLTDRKFAEMLDERDPLRHFRQQFCYPKKRDLPGIDAAKYSQSDEECIYMCGHSLGLMPKSTPQFIQRELDKWAAMGVHGHRHGELPWAFCDESLTEQSAEIVGANNDEVAIMNGLTVNEHLLLISFYQPTADRHKILIEDHAFPSDHYCAESQIRQRGYDPVTSLICIKPRQGEDLLRTEDILETIEREGDTIAVILLPGVQYYTGQLLDMAAITEAGHMKGCFVGFDLAHAVGNVELHLHDWNVDFACWCTYKYLNAGAGSYGGFFIHARHALNEFPKLLGWWSHRIETRFDMTNVLELSLGAAAYRISNPSGLLAASLKASLDVFSQTSMSELRAKSKLLTGYLEHLLKTEFGNEDHQQQQHLIQVDIVTPQDPQQRGCQLSVRFSIEVDKVFNELSKEGVVIDKRFPHVLRLGPCPLYNSFTDVHQFVRVLQHTVQKLSA